MDSQATMSTNASTTDTIIQPDDSRIVWSNATSMNGRKYRIGTLKTSDSDPAVPSAPADDKPSGDKPHPPEFIVHEVDDIYWPVSTPTWLKPAQRIIDQVDISRYYVTKNPGWWYDYILYITNTENWSYTFYDETGDSYGLNCYQQGDHYVAYDSTQPTIVKIVATA